MSIIYTFVFKSALEAFLISTISSLLVSFIFLWFVLHKLRPIIKISSHVCRRPEKYDNNGIEDNRNKYSFKIVNKSIYDTFDINVELLLLTPINHTGAKSNLASRHLSVRTSNMTHISRFRRKDSHLDPFKRFAILIHTNEDLDNFLKVQNSFVQIRITARHGLSGLAKTFEQHFSDPSVIKIDHKFEHGENCETMPFNKSI